LVEYPALLGIKDKPKEIEWLIMALYKKNILQSIKNLSNDTKQFKSELKYYLHALSLYSIDEYFSINRE
jgi:hypothetical protein